MKTCTICGKTKPLEEFYNDNSPDSIDNKSKICKECSKMYYQKHRENMIEKYGEEEYKKMQWEKKLRASAKKSGISLVDEINYEKISILKIKMIDYPDKGLPLSLNHIEFMKKYDLSVNEYLYLRELITSGQFLVLNRKV
jgi:hypothetical protein